MESDKKKYPMKRCIICKKKMIGKNLIRHAKTHNTSSKEMINHLLQYQRQYEKDTCDGVVLKELIEKMVYTGKPSQIKSSKLL